MIKFRLSALLIFLCSMLFVVGCKKDLGSSSNCFKLTAVYLYQGSNTACASNVWKVENSTDADIPVGTYVQFTTNDSYDPINVKLCDIVNLRLTMKVMTWAEPYCPYQCSYFLQGDLCN